MPTVTNPALPAEDFNRHWDQAKYENFREKIHQYREWIDDAYNEPDRDQSIAKWQRVFGDEFAKGEIAGKATAVAGTALQVVRATSTDLLAAVRRWGPALLERIPTNLPWVSPPEWPRSGRAQISIRAFAYSERGSGQIGEVKVRRHSAEGCLAEVHSRRPVRQAARMAHQVASGQFGRGKPGGSRLAR